MIQQEIDRLWEGFMFWCEVGSNLSPKVWERMWRSFPGMVMIELPNLLLALDRDHCLDEIRGIKRTKKGNWERVEGHGAVFNSFSISLEDLE